ncbi:T9SS type B sorting domain-containing protein [Fulvivirga sp. RKSG066]|uniref:FG-GAP-like repeat-containing protein n=1 Tax=Fulvivirga aurantia TaxID=2529383 RepID=UPI0012BC363A|nr:FG-GAP-like repeat-containing protein [Fulvivirga aurantia]MTI21972.1 T9SS type B sorting domain-containing protein [Fulvivirga aurantia]
MKLTVKYCLLSCLFSFLTLSVVAQVPVIKNVSPTSGYSGQTVNIKGGNFEAGSRVFFGSVEGTVISSSDQLIEATVPTSATFDNVSVLNPTSDRTAYAPSRFFSSFGGTNGIAATDFDTQLDLTAEDGLYDICVCDLDGDDKNDIVGANSKNNRATILRNLSTPGTLSVSKTPINLNAKTLNVTCGDLNGDGKPEVVFTEGDDGNRIFILINNSPVGSLSFTMQTITVTGASTKRVAINDLDLDGHPDLTVTDQSTNKVFLIKNTTVAGTLSFDTGNITELTVGNAGSTAGIEVQDLNGDRKPEIIVSQFFTDGGGFYIANNKSTPGNFSFDAFSQNNSSGTFVNLKVADINNDGKPDIAATLFLSSTIAFFINQTSSVGANPTFSSAQQIATSARPWGIDLSDMDGDGLNDFVIATVGTGLSVNILNNTGSGFNTVSIPVTYINRNIKAADIDGDTKPDLVFSSVDDEANGINASRISILRNNQCVTPVIEPGGPISSCNGNTSTLTTQSIPGATYEWRRDATLEKTGADNFIDAAVSGDYTVTVISEGGSCTEVSTAVTVEVKAAGALPPGSIISPSEPVCIGGTLTLEAANIGATKYEWRGPQGYTATGRISSPTINDFRFANTGRYYLDIYSGDCVIETVSILVEAINSPEFSVSQSGSGTYCEGSPVTLSISPNNPGFTYQWYNDSGLISGATGISYSPTVSGNYYAEASDTMNPSCPAIATNNLSVEILSLPTADFSSLNNSCTNVSIQFTDVSTLENSNVSYLWDFGDGVTSTQQNPSHSYQDADTYNVTLTVNYNDLSCSDQITKQIKIEGQVDISITASATSFCEGDEVELTVPEGFENYNWSTGEATASINVTEGGTYSVSLTDELGCLGEAEIDLTKLTSPEVEIISSRNNIAPGEAVIITASGLASFNWEPDSIVNDPSSAEIEVNPFFTTLFSVNGEGANGCPGSAEIEIRVLQDKIGSLLTPKKYFSPNGDEKNQFWEIEKIDQFNICGVEIFDQAGNKLFDAKPYNNDWEGTYGGKKLPSGVYYYVIKCDDVGIVKSGSITLLK